MLETKKISEMLAMTINSITEEYIENDPKAVARLLNNYESIARHIDEKIFTKVEPHLENIKSLPKQIKHQKDTIDIVNASYNLRSETEKRAHIAVSVKKLLERDLKLAENFLELNKESVDLFNLISNHALYFLELVKRNTELYFEDLTQGNLDFSSKRLKVIEDLTSLLNKLSQQYNINTEQ